jgi:hypothetical protein
MRIRAGLASGKHTPFTRSRTASWTLDSNYLLGAGFWLHGKNDAPKPTYDYGQF